MVSSAASGARAEKTRAAVLEAAEILFSEKGFDGTRLEDIAERVGIRRASIVYYFKDKRELYEAVLGSVFGELREAVGRALGRDAPALERVEEAVSVWVDYVGRRPTLARLLLRETADVAGGGRLDLLQQLKPFIELVQREIFGRPDFERRRRNDPVRVASTVAGSTIFYVAVIPTLLPDFGVTPASRDGLEAHKREMLRIVRRLFSENPEP